MNRCALLAVALALGLGSGAQAEERRLLSTTEAAAFRAVGRLNVYGSRFCTATLIDPRHVLTAAHCLYSPITKRLVRLHGLVFVAGQYRDTEAAARRVVRMATLPGFDFSEAAGLGQVRRDMALLELDEPIEGDIAAPLAVASQGGDGGGTIVSYARDRPYAPSIEENCAPLSTVQGVVILGCGVNSGVSGAPVLAGPSGGRRVVGVVSAMAKDRAGRDITLSVVAPPRMKELRAALAAQPVTNVADQEAARPRRRNQ